MPREKKHRLLPDVRSICGFDPSTDSVVRRGERVFITSTSGLADVEVKPDEITLFHIFAYNTARVESVHALEQSRRWVAGCATMSPEGRRERLLAIDARLAELASV